MPNVITDPEQVTPEWLTDVLARNGVAAQVARINVEPLMQGKSRIAPLEIRYEQPTHAPARLILKLSPQEDRDRREVDFYAAVQGSTNLPIIRCYDAAYADGHFHILMEDLRETHDSHPPSFLPLTLANSERIVDALAQFHAYWWDSEKLGQVIGTRPSVEALTQSVAADIALLSGFADFLGDRLSDERRNILEQVSSRLIDLKTKRLMPKRALTLIHEDLHAGNFLYPRDPARDTIRLIDWKSWSINPGANDMANLMAVYWTQERRQQLQDRLLHRYQARLSEYGVRDYAWDNCWHDYRLAVIGDLFFPIWQWSVGTPDFIWWHNFDRLMLAYRDLDCEDLL